MGNDALHVGYLGARAVNMMGPDCVTPFGRVLIATDEPNFTRGLIEGYRSLGWQVVTGVAPFRSRVGQYDVIHHLWPEEFSSWGPPTPQQLREIGEDLDWWRHRAVSIFTVNNLYPHQNEKSVAFHQLYSIFYRNCQLVTHYTQASRRAVLREFPAARSVEHVVHSPGNYEVTLATQTARGSRRKSMGIDDDEFVVLVLGRVRSWEEAALIRRAFSGARVAKKRLLMAGKLAIKTSGFSSRLRRLSWSLWLRRVRAVSNPRYVPESEVSQFLDSCDLVLVPRLSGLNSAILFVGMTFGRALLVPRIESYLECIAGTRNLIYETGDAGSLSRCIEEANRTELESIGRENAALAATWKWRDMVQACLAAVPARSQQRA